MESRWSRVKRWCKNHEVELAAGATIAVYAAAVVVAMKVDIRNQRAYQQAVSDRNQRITNAINSGKQILPNPDGSFWIIDIPVNA